MAPVARKTIWVDIPAWDLRRGDRFVYKGRNYTVVRAKKARGYGPPEGIELEVEVEGERDLKVIKVDATKRFELFDRRGGRRRPK
jgi:hypothetical protein